MDFIRGQNTATFLGNLISKYDFGPVKLPGLSRNGPQGGKRPCTTRLRHAYIITHNARDVKSRLFDPAQTSSCLKASMSFDIFEQLL